ncbi:nucleotide-diphospho-sugar transferase [Cladochytrium replicatum]|nr:nucleotide-diphospho-sugar transferase [Cladochytrium replicatum]
MLPTKRPRPHDLNDTGKLPYPSHFRRRCPSLRPTFLRSPVFLIVATVFFFAGLLWERTSTNKMPGHLIPKIFHQSWKNAEVPPRMVAWSSTWKKLNPDYEYKLWTDEGNLELCRTHFPWFLPTFEALPKNILRADVSRYMYMYQYGGVYADLDVEAVQPVSVLWTTMQEESDRGESFFYTGQSAVEAMGPTYAKGTVDMALPLMGEDWTWEHNVPNAWLASRPRHGFWLHLLHRVIWLWNKHKEDFLAERIRVEALTGPEALYRAVEDYARDSKPGNATLGVAGEALDKLYFVRPGIIFPYDWRHFLPGTWEICSAEAWAFDEDECKLAYGATGKKGSKPISITYWSHSWEGKSNERIYQMPLQNS